ncbi:MAG: MarC family protein [Candidatus Bathyarchaeia archaeon]|nr:MarC family protein [Candidatus Bathyarchaeota archaeon]
MESFTLSLFKAVIALLIVIDPLGNIPLFIGLTKDMKKKDKKKAFNTATIVAFFLLILFVVTGKHLLNLFNISIYSFMIAGGILLLIISIKILIYGEWTEKVISPENIGAVPIAFPLLTGPGAITTAIVIIQTSGFLATFLAVLIVFFLVWLTLQFIDEIHSFLGRIGSTVIARLMAIFIAAISIQFIIDGVNAYR